MNATDGSSLFCMVTLASNLILVAIRGKTATLLTSATTNRLRLNNRNGIIDAGTPLLSFRLKIDSILEQSELFPPQTPHISVFTLENNWPSQPRNWQTPFNIRTDQQYISLSGPYLLEYKYCPCFHTNKAFRLLNSPSFRTVPSILRWYISIYIFSRLESALFTKQSINTISTTYVRRSRVVTMSYFLLLFQQYPIILGASCIAELSYPRAVRDKGCCYISSIFPTPRRKHFRHAKGWKKRTLIINKRKFHQARVLLYWYNITFSYVGLLHFLVRNWTPVPQDLEHDPQGPQLLHPPSWGFSIIGIRSALFFSMSSQ